ncbi:ABC transporter substrate-binding protein [Thermodesulfobacteriota bacterium]
MKTKLYLIVIVLIVSVFMFSGYVLSADQKPKTVAELALYKGADRQQILEGGARKEGKLTMYTTGILKQTVRPKVKAFQKKYPYIKVEIWRASTSKLLPRVLEEYKTSRQFVDVIELSQAAQLVLEETGILQPFYSPELAHIEEGALRRASGGGVSSAGHYSNARVLGYNTKLINREELPKTHQDLLDPKWKEKVALARGMGALGWMGAILDAYGEDLVRRLAKQNFDVHMVSARALLDMIIGGEYVCSPGMAEAHVKKSRQEGAPIDYVVLEPAFVILGQIVLPKHSAHPHAAMLYINFDLTKEVGELYSATGYVSPRKDVSGEETYKKYYGPFSTKQYAQWEELFSGLFLKK